MFESMFAEVTKLQTHLQLLREEYVKLQTRCAELEKQNQVALASAGQVSEDNFVSRLLRTVAELFDTDLYRSVLSSCHKWSGISGSSGFLGISGSLGFPGISGSSGILGSPCISGSLGFLDSFRGFQGFPESRGGGGHRSFPRNQEVSIPIDHYFITLQIIFCYK